MYTEIEGKGLHYASEHMQALRKERLTVEDGFLAAADIIATTYGPGGSNVVISVAGGQGAHLRPISTQDGVTVSRNIQFEDGQMATGAKMLLLGCEATVAAAADGTTLTAILSQAFLTALTRMRGATKNMSRKQLVEHTANLLFAALEKTIDDIRRPASESILESVAYVSMKGNRDVAKGIAKAVWEAGVSGHITLDRGDGEGVSVDTVEGYSWEWGFLHNAMYPGNNPMNTVVFNNPIILLVEDKIDSVGQAREIVDAISAHFPRGADGTWEHQFIVVASDVSGAAMDSFVSTVGAFFRGEGGMPIAAVKAPGYGDERFQYLSDLKASIGAEAIVYRAGGYSFDKLKKKKGAFGSAKRVTVRRGKTTIEFDPQYYDAIQTHLESIKDDTNYNERRAKLLGGIIKIKVAHPVKHVEDVLFMAVEDAVGAASNALKTGAVPGATYATRYLAHILGTDLSLPKHLTKAQKEMLKDALYTPTLRLYHNFFEDSKYRIAPALPIAAGVHNLDTGEFEAADNTTIMDSCAAFEHSVRNAFDAGANMFLTSLSITLHTAQQ